MLNQAAEERADRTAADAVELIREKCVGGKVEVSSAVQIGKPARMIGEAAWIAFRRCSPSGTWCLVLIVMVPS